MKNNCFIYHHLGLGDHLICNGMVRYIVNKFEYVNFSLVVKEQNSKNVERMYSDLDRLDLHVVKEDAQFIEYCKNNPNTLVLKAGFEKTRLMEFDKSFYDCLQVPFNERWDSWSFDRDSEQENKIIQELEIDGEYIFVHDSSSVDNYDLNIDSDLPQIRPQKLSSEKSIFDWLGVIEGAKEIHCIDSSFIHLIDSYKFNNDKYYHTIKTSKLQNGIGFSLQNKWKTINY